MNTVKTDTDASRPIAAQEIQDEIVALLEGLPPETLMVARQFAAFLRKQAQQGRPVTTATEPEGKLPYLYPTVPVPFSSLEGLIGVMPPVGGDALADTEALYDEV